MYTGDIHQISRTADCFWHTAEFGFVCILYTTWYILAKSVHTASIVGSFKYSHHCLLCRIRVTGTPVLSSVPRFQKSRLQTNHSLSLPALLHRHTTCLVWLCFLSLSLWFVLTLTTPVPGVDVAAYLRLALQFNERDPDTLSLFERVPDPQRMARCGQSTLASVHPR